MLMALEGADALDAKLADLPGDLQALLEVKANMLAERLATKVRDVKLSGEALQTKSGALRASIVSDVSTTNNMLSATVGSAGDIKYAAIQEYGGHTAAHQIVATKSAALAFVMGGATHFAHSVQHPGSLMPARAYLSSSLNEMREDIIAALADAANQAWEAS